MNSPETPITALQRKMENKLVSFLIYEKMIHHNNATVIISQLFDETQIMAL